MAMQVEAKYDVGGVMLDRPFKIRRLGHFGFNVLDMPAARHFYVDLLGFRISDELDFARRVEDKSILEGLGDTRGYFTRYGGDHHALVLFPKRVRDALGGGNRRFAEGVTVNQITWQLGSLSEVINATNWLRERGTEMQRSGRDMPGSNWHTYMYDPDGHTNELYYGIEQVGWEGFSKPLPMHDRRFAETPSLPQISEFQEVQQAMQAGVDFHTGYRYVDPLPATFDVDGILLPRPFKIVRIGPVGTFVQDLDAATAFYRDTLGFAVTEETVYQGQRCVFLRANTEHHSVALYPIALRETLGFSSHSTTASFGVQLANYRQLRDAVQFLRDNGVRVVQHTDPALHPGMDYVAHAFDPDGHAIQIYYYMEQVGWDGRPRPAAQRRVIDVNNWPDRVEPLSDTYEGEPYLGPWG